MKKNPEQNKTTQDTPSEELQADASAPDDSEENKPPQKYKPTTADIIKFAGLLLFIALIVIVGVFLLPYFEQLTSEEGRLALIDQIKSAGFGGVAICLGLQFVQIVVAFIPGEVVQVAIGAIYGPVLGTLIIVVGALISSVFIFFVVRKLGAPFVHGMIGSKDSKILNFLDKGSRLNVIVFILFLIPGLPKDVFTYLVPLTKMRPANFFILSTLGRIPAIAASAFVGSAAVQGDYTQAIVVGVIAGGLGLLGIIFNKQILNTVDRVEAHFKELRKTSADTDSE